VTGVANVCVMFVPSPSWSCAELYDAGERKGFRIEHLAGLDFDDVVVDIQP
jgi:hypothetical protein